MIKRVSTRDIVARAIDNEIKMNDDDHVFLDISMRDKKYIIDRFPYL